MNTDKTQIEAQAITLKPLFNAVAVYDKRGIKLSEGDSVKIECDYANDSNGLIKKVRSKYEKKINFEKRDGKIFEMITLKTNPEKRNFNIKPEINGLEKGFYGDVVVHVEDGIIQSSEIRKRKRIKS